MAEPFLGEIRAFGFNFAPVDWATCAGQLISIFQNQALFALLGTMYGGDGHTTFALPDLRGRVAMGAGAGRDLTPRQFGQKMGQESVRLNDLQIPAHAHSVSSELTAKLHCSERVGESNSPVDALIGVAEQKAFVSQEDGHEMKIGSVTLEGPITVQNTGGNQPHDNLQPSLVVNYCISLRGYFPSRS